MTTYLTQQNSNQDFQYNQKKTCGITKSYPSRTIVHPKLEMTEPGDHDEQEADTVANTIAAGGKIRRKISGGSGSSGITVSNQMESQLSHLQGGGQAMPSGLRNMMESGFGQDFSHVRLHTDSEAASLSSSIHAKAFTHGNDIYFNQGQFSPNTTEGQKLMAHELTHVVQGGGKIGRNNELSYEQDIPSKSEKVGLILYGQGGIHNKEGNGYYHDVGKAYQKSAQAQQKKLSENDDFQDINIITAHVPNKTSFIEQIQNVDDNSLCYLCVYSHGMSDQIVLGGFDKGNDIDLHIEDLHEYKELFDKKFRQNAIIELWGCNQGNSDYEYDGGITCIAQELANIIGKGVKVYAYNTGTKFKFDPKTGHHIYDGETIASKSGGKRIEFSSTNREESYNDSQTIDRSSIDTNVGFNLDPFSFFYKGITLDEDPSFIPPVKPYKPSFNYFKNGRLNINGFELGKDKFPYKLNKKEYFPIDPSSSGVFDHLFPPKAKDYDFYYMRIPLSNYLKFSFGPLFNNWSPVGGAFGLRWDF